MQIELLKVEVNIYCKDIEESNANEAPHSDL